MSASPAPQGHSLPDGRGQRGGDGGSSLQLNSSGRSHSGDGDAASVSNDEASGRAQREVGSEEPENMCASVSQRV